MFPAWTLESLDFDRWDVGIEARLTLVVSQARHPMHAESYNVTSSIDDGINKFWVHLFCTTWQRINRNYRPWLTDNHPLERNWLRTGLTRLLHTAPDLQKKQTASMLRPTLQSTFQSNLIVNPHYLQPWMSLCHKEKRWPYISSCLQITLVALQ